MAQGDLRGTLTASVNSVTNPTVATGSVAVSIGDLVFVTMSQQTNLTASSCTDNLGNTYSAVNAGTDAGTVSIRSFYARVTIGGTLTQVNVAATASTNDASVVADVIEGPFLTSPLDANPANTTDGTTPFTCPATGTLAQASEVVMAAIAIAGNQTVAATSPSLICGTVARSNASTGQSRHTVSATSSVTPQFTGTSATSGQVTASFKLDTSRRAQISWGELEIPLGPRQSRISWAEFEIPNGQRRSTISWAELELPNAPRRAQFSWAEIETPNPPRRAQVSWAELELPSPLSNERMAQVSWAEIEIPNGQRRAQVSWSELEIPLGPRRAEVSWAELEVPGLPTRMAQISWAEFEVPGIDSGGGYGGRAVRSRRGMLRAGSGKRRGFRRSR